MAEAHIDQMPRVIGMLHLIAIEVGFGVDVEFAKPLGLGHQLIVGIVELTLAAFSGILVCATLARQHVSSPGMGPANSSSRGHDVD